MGPSASEDEDVLEKSLSLPALQLLFGQLKLHVTPLGGSSLACTAGLQPPAWLGGLPPDSLYFAPFFCAGASKREHSWMPRRRQCAALLASLPRGCSACSRARGHRRPRAVPRPSGTLSPFLWGTLTSSHASSAAANP